VDRVVSTQGIASWYDFLCNLAPDAAEESVPSPDPSVSELIQVVSSDSAGQVAVIVAHGNSEAGGDPLCVRVLEEFCDTVGAEAANLAMRFMALGGIFIAGDSHADVATQ
jgi:glucokinase